MDLEFAKASIILTRPSRLRSVSSLLATYDFNLMKPRLRGQNYVLYFGVREVPGGN